MDLHRQVNPGVTDEATAISYDPAGNITQVKATLPGGQIDNQCFSYDQLQQLTEWGVCQLNGVTRLCCHAAFGLERRPSNRMSNALSACFQRWVQRALPRPVGSSAMTAR